MNILLYTKEQTDINKFLFYIEDTYQVIPTLNEGFDWTGVVNQADKVTIYTIPNEIFDVIEVRKSVPDIKVLCIEGNSYIKTTFNATPATNIDKTIIQADGVDFITISDTPSGILTAINNETKEEVSGAIDNIDTFSTTVTGTYTITIAAEGHEDFITTIEAV